MTGGHLRASARGVTPHYLAGGGVERSGGVGVPGVHGGGEPVDVTVVLLAGGRCGGWRDGAPGARR